MVQFAHGHAQVVTKAYSRHLDPYFEMLPQAILSFSFDQYADAPRMYSVVLLFEKPLYRPETPQRIDLMCSFHYRVENEHLHIVWQLSLHSSLFSYLFDIIIDQFLLILCTDFFLNHLTGNEDR